MISSKINIGSETTIVRQIPAGELSADFFNHIKNLDLKINISLIIPVFQEEKILEKTLLSYPRNLREKFGIELIVSDGGSTDKTVDIARKYADVIVVHKEERKQTIAEGRNRGAEVARGNILVFLNGDTMPENTEEFFYYVKHWSSDAERRGFAALTCQVNVAPEERIFKDRIFYTLHNAYVHLLNILGIGMGRGECQIVMAGVFRQIGGYNSKIAAGEDFDLFRRIAGISRICFTNKIKVFESPRRFRKYGYVKIIMSWIINSLSVMISGKSVSKEWEAVR